MTPRERLEQAARILREWAGERQHQYGKWTTREQAAVDCAIELEQMAEAETAREAETPPQAYAAGYQAALREAAEPIVEAYHKAEDNWAAQCFCFTSASEQMRRDAHEVARDGFNEIAHVLGVVARPLIKAEYVEAAQRAREEGR